MVFEPVVHSITALRKFSSQNVLLSSPKVKGFTQQLPNLPPREEAEARCNGLKLSVLRMTFVSTPLELAMLLAVISGAWEAGAKVKVLLNLLEAVSAGASAISELENSSAAATSEASLPSSALDRLLLLSRLV